MSSGTEERRGSLRWIASAFAIVLTLAVIAGLVYFRVASRVQPTSPSVGTASVRGVTFSCRLPVLGGAAAGFISFPDGAITIDHSVNLTNSKSSYYGYTYDSPVRKWVPVPRSALSPDGRAYAYMTQTTGVPGETASLSLHTHDIASGSDHLLWQGSGSPMGPQSVTWLAGGIYFSAVLYSSDVPQGPMFPAVYVADPNKASAPRRVGPNPAPQPPGPGQTYFQSPDQFMWVGPGAAWGIGQPAQKQPSSPTEAQPTFFGPDRILRMDLRDGSVSTWFMANTGYVVSVMALDSQGRPIISLIQPKMPEKNAPSAGTYEPPPITLLLLTGQNQTTEISAANPDFHLGSQPAADSHGIWFGSWNSIWLYKPNGGLQQVASIQSDVFPSPSPPPGYPAKGDPASGAKPQMPAYMQGTLLMPAGPCA